jgi:hypothetical protein
MIYCSNAVILGTVSDKKVRTRYFFRFFTDIFLKPLLLQNRTLCEIGKKLQHESNVIKKKLR